MAPTPAPKITATQTGFMTASSLVVRQVPTLSRQSVPMDEHGCPASPQEQPQAPPPPATGQQQQGLALHPAPGAAAPLHGLAVHEVQLGRI
jgi:hypothetical protein